jgi:hypothetical protein
MTPRCKRLVAVLAATAAITACTTTAVGTPHPASDSESAGSSTTESSGSSPTTSAKEEAPKVSDPLDASGFVAAPCASITPARLANFAVNPPGEVRELEGVPQGCDWNGNDGSIGIDWLYQNKGGLSDTYRGGSDLNAYFIETVVDGYPGVFVDGTDGRPSGRCGIVVGVSDTLTFYVQVFNGQLGADGSCAQAKQVAAAALATVKEAN